MATQIADLWGRFEPAEVRTPLSILRQQAALLGDKTNHLVEARVNTYALGPNIYHAFNLVVPALEDYTYQLFRVSHGVELYPVSANSTEGHLQWHRELENEEAFVGWLSSSFSSEATKRIISTLMAQAAG
ncbi:MAG: hypothetical protein Q8N47_09690 [Bryobacterales bacterium]|nr:hypothetical protein [Bryobacterales bacterium]